MRTVLPTIPCSYQNHRNMGVEYACLHPLCQENNHCLGCLYCCQEYHQDHMQHVTAIKLILKEVTTGRSYAKEREFKVLEMLMKGIETSRNFQELQTTFAEVMAFRKNPQRFEQLLDQEMQALQRRAQQYYERSLQQQVQSSISRKSSQLVKPAITPVLSFKEHPNCIHSSPFSVALARNQLTTVVALPSLSKFHQSIDITLKIERYTPSWLAIGVSIGQSKYQQGSQKHLLAISNGWLANRGVLQRSKVKFSAGDEVRVKWDKNMELLQFITAKNGRTAVKLENKWSEEVFLCVCLFYEGDAARILA